MEESFIDGVKEPDGEKLVKPEPEQEQQQRPGDETRVKGLENALDVPIVSVAKDEWPARGRHRSDAIPHVVKNFPARPRTKAKKEQRMFWMRKADFIVACVAMTVGLGNVSGIVRMCIVYDGGSFMFAYTFTAIFIAFPVIVLEVSLGQFTSSGGMASWDICPLMKGVTISSALTITVVLCYQTVTISWVLFYIFASWTKIVPWSHCTNSYNTKNCTMANFTLTKNVSEVLKYAANSTTPNRTDYSERKNYHMAVEEHWELKVLNLSQSIYELGTLQWQMCLIVLAVWTGVFLFIATGINYTSKIMYVTVSVPYVLMAAIFIRMCTLNHATAGIAQFFTFRQSQLTNMDIWNDACHEVLFSFSLGLGVLPVLGSYNEYFYDSFRDTVIFVAFHLITVLVSSIFLFALISPTFPNQDYYLIQGPSIMFHAYPEALAAMPVAPVWSTVFYAMIFVMAIDYQIFGAFTVVTTVVDNWPRTFMTRKRRAMLAGAYCSATYVVGLMMCTQGGLYVYTVFTTIATAKLLVFVCTVETCVISWVYGSERFIDNFTIMTGRHAIKRAMISLQFVTPIYLVIVLLYDVLLDEDLITRSSASVKYELPSSIYNISRWLSVMIATSLPGYASYVVIKKWRRVREARGTLKVSVSIEDKSEFMEVLKKLIKPILPQARQRRVYDRADYSASRLISPKNVAKVRCKPTAITHRSMSLNLHREVTPATSIALLLQDFRFQDSEEQFNILGRRTCDVTVDVVKSYEK